MLRSASDRKTTVFSLPRDHLHGFLPLWNYYYPGRRARTYLSLPTPVSHLSISVHNCRTKAHLQIKRVSSLYSFIFCIELAWSHLFHSIFLDSAVNMQQSTMKEGDNKAYWLQHHAAAGKDIAWICWIVTSVGNNPGWSCSLFGSPRQEITFKVFRV